MSLAPSRCLRFLFVDDLVVGVLDDLVGRRLAVAGEADAACWLALGVDRLCQRLGGLLERCVFARMSATSFVSSAWRSS